MRKYRPYAWLAVSGQSPTFSRWAALGVMATLVPLSGCEAVLGAEFDDYGLSIHDAALGDMAASDTGSEAGNGAGGASNDDAGGATGGTAGSGNTGTGGGRGGTNSGGTNGGGGTTGGTAPVDVHSDRPVFDGPTALGDASPDTSAPLDAPGDLTTMIDAPPPPPRDGGVTGGGCTPGEVHAIATCGYCGIYLQTCNAQGVWDPPSCRQEAQACAPGSSEQRACETNGTTLATCNASCQWTVGPCTHPTCTAGQVEQQSCALCGQQTRTCLVADGSAAWGPFSTCGQQGICAAGSTDVTTCGNCGTHSRVCNTACAWNAWGACLGEGECAPGTTQTEDCTIILPIVVLGHRTRTCSASCGWGPFGDCK